MTEQGFEDWYFHNYTSLDLSDFQDRDILSVSSETKWTLSLRFI